MVITTSTCTETLPQDILLFACIWNVLCRRTFQNTQTTLLPKTKSAIFNRPYGRAYATVSD